MTLRHLRIFLAVYQEMSITKASKKLHLAQPSVSLAIKELEEFYHIRLFDRINRRIFVTEKGEGFYDYASHIIDLFDEMENSMISPDMPLKISIGSSITIGSYIVPQTIAEFHKKYPACEVKVKIQNSQNIVQAVLKNELDLGLVEDKVQHEQLKAVPFMQDELYFVCGSHHPLAEEDSLTLEDICGYPFFMREPGSASREITDGLLKAHQQKANIQWESVSNQSLIRAVEVNPGITVLSGKLIEEEVKRGSVVILPVHPEAFIRNFTLIYHKKKFMTQALEALVSLF
ncbi:LysR family transcriptional regulator [Faecalicatena sp. AGMB00832]|uniref:LysR family transcriptional regulator n=1 Tax=Faecalicatena faecalis TaxID=2726362 RepID=A0ABS6D1M2_9FIRM|nr:LysR family transcriptional regulator [Faecalicatena faecalis]MBU3875230.1 LysR family transcriptional regulator [Faecalicatena faecalis]